MTMKASKDRVQHRLKIIKGQINGLEKMVGENKYCVDILTLSLAVQHALKEMDQLVMEGHIKNCVAGAAQSGKTNRMADELTNLFSLVRK